VQLPPIVTTDGDFIDLHGSKVNADIQLDYRRKGMLWFPVYYVDFHGVYYIRNTASPDYARRA
jgi:hypothetical protein